ncbi:MAG: hypothetical protein JW945_00585 [Methanomicrobia archaeon]|nr:hypothetical protein [Methanomicrobia archaeon]
MKHEKNVVENEKERLEGIYAKLTPIPVFCVLIGTLFMVGCIAPGPERPAGTMSVAALLADPIYDTEVTVYGQVALLGELLCPCFELSSGGETVQVWYDLMVEDDGTERPAVSVEEIENGDWVLVKGELKSAGVHRAANDFWTTSIERIEDLEEYGISPSPSGKEFTEAESREIARVFVENSPTYQYDGFDLRFNRSEPLRCPCCWLFVFEFTSRHAGYGNRTGQVLAQVITPHTAQVVVNQGAVTSATLDEQWDMLTQAQIADIPGREELEAREIARSYVLNMDAYQTYEGRDLTVTNVLQARCPGCWQVELEFFLTSEKDPSRIDRATVTVTLDNWVVVDVIYAQGGLEPLTYDEARAIAENSTCVQEGTLTDTYVYNEYTRTWWIDLEPFTEKEGCNPACVVSEDTRTAEINWRCTGLLPPGSEEGNETQQTVCVTGTGESMNLSEALLIAAASECSTIGMITTNAFCNAVTGTWWLDLEPYEPKEGCNPACVVNITTKTADVNWRCTGLILPE